MTVPAFDLTINVDARWSTWEALRMSQTGPNVFAWDGSPSPDVVGYRMRIKPTPATFSKSDPYEDLGNVLLVDLATVAGYSGLDGKYDLALSAVDEGGNESSAVVLTAVPLDLVPPQPPTNFRRVV